jgi:Phage portal protein
MPIYNLSSEQMLTQTQSHYLRREKYSRGINLYTSSETWSVMGYGRQGELLQGEIERPLFGLTLEERINLFRMCSPVFGIVTARMNRLAALEWDVECDRKTEDRIESRMKMAAGIYKECDNPLDWTHIGTRVAAQRMIKQYLPEIKPDLSNFQSALLRWRKKLREVNEDESERIKDWLMQPNAHDSYDDFIKKSVQDAMVHGSWAWYKETVSNKIENLYCLPGGTVIPFRARYVSPMVAFIQMIPAVESKVYFKDEIVYKSYCPSSAMAYGMIPLECLVNKLAEVLFFDQAAAMRADGTAPPDKIALFGETSPFGDLTGSSSGDFSMPLSTAEQSRLETIINQPRKGAIRVLSGYGQPAILDLSKADTFSYQDARQEKIKQEVALVYNMSNNEINMTGSEDTSGRSTSESQERIEREKGIYPIVKMIESAFNTEVLPWRFDYHYKLEYKAGLSDEEELAMDTNKIKSQLYAINEIRMTRNEEPFPDPKFDLPMGGGQGMPGPDGSKDDPLHMKQLTGGGAG